MKDHLAACVRLLQRGSSRSAYNCSRHREAKKKVKTVKPVLGMSIADSTTTDQAIGVIVLDVREGQPAQVTCELVEGIVLNGFLDGWHQDGRHNTVSQRHAYLIARIVWKGGAGLRGISGYWLFLQLSIQSCTILTEVDVVLLRNEKEMVKKVTIGPSGGSPHINK